MVERLKEFLDMVWRRLTRQRWEVPMDEQNEHVVQLGPEDFLGPVKRTPEPHEEPYEPWARDDSRLDPDGAWEEWPKWR
jgi:hypothetical protein